MKFDEVPRQVERLIGLIATRVLRAIGAGDTPPRIAFLMCVAVCILLLSIRAGVTDVPRHEYREAFICLSAATILTVVFFRRRMLALVSVWLAFIILNAGLTAIFHPSVLGFALTVGAAAATYFFAKWDSRRYPEFTAKDWKLLFDNDGRKRRIQETEHR